MKKAFLSIWFLSATIIAGAAELTPPPSAARPDLNERQRELLRRYDKNADGRIDEEEKAAARADMRRGAYDPTGKAGREKKLLKHFDRNGNGVLEPAERAVAARARENFEAKRTAFEKRFDRNGDGLLDETERAEARKAYEALLARREARRARSDHAQTQ